jgi:tRNA-splicing endonuclease subunit Sen2
MAEAAAEAEAAFAEGREASVIAVPSGATWKPQQNGESIKEQFQNQATSLELNVDTNEEETQQEEEPLEDVEHLQLTLQEAFFLIWNFDCLTVLDPLTVRSVFSETSISHSSQPYI